MRITYYARGPSRSKLKRYQALPSCSTYTILGKLTVTSAFRIFGDQAQYRSIHPPVIQLGTVAADVTAHYARHLLCARSEASQNKVLSSHARGRKYLMTITTTTTTGVGAGVLISLFISDMEAMRKQRNQRVRSDEVAAG